jgi:hypothetical protein
MRNKRRSADTRVKIFFQPNSGEYPVAVAHVRLDQRAQLDHKDHIDLACLRRRQNFFPFRPVTSVILPSNLPTGTSKIVRYGDDSRIVARRHVVGQRKPTKKRA